MAGDWIRLYRKIVDSRTFDDPWLFRLWIWCLVRAGWAPGWENGRHLEPGQFVTGLRVAAQQLGTSLARLHRGLRQLAEWGQIQVEADSTFSVVTICNWGMYQCAGFGTPAERQRNASGTPAERAPYREEGKEGNEGEAPPTPRGAGETAAAEFLAL